jgi:hypothetical protein
VSASQHDEAAAERVQVDLDPNVSFMLDMLVRQTGESPEEVVARALRLLLAERAQHP